MKSSREFLLKNSDLKNLKIISFNFENQQFAKFAFAIRRAVFVEEQKVDPVLEYDHEEEATHYLLYLDEIPVSTGRWRKTAEGIKLERFATLKEFRNQGIGTELLKKVLADVIPMGSKIYLNSQLAAIPFYEKHGFKKEGDLFYEAGMAHYKMIFSKK